MKQSMRQKEHSERERLANLAADEARAASEYHDRFGRWPEGLSWRARKVLAFTFGCDERQTYKDMEL